MRALSEVTQKLRRRFSAVEIRPPGEEAQLNAALNRLPEIPHALLEFWQHCDGLIVTQSENGEIFGLGRAVEAFPVLEAHPLSNRLVPIRTDGCGNYDCVVVGAGPCEDAVVFWDREVYDNPAYLLGGSFPSYLRMWADHVVNTHLPDGEPDPRTSVAQLATYPWIGRPEYEHPWPFDEAWIRSRDPLAARWLDDAASRRWLVRQDDRALR